VAAVQVGDVEQRKYQPCDKARNASQRSWQPCQEHCADDCDREDEDADAQTLDKTNGVSGSDQRPSAEPSPDRRLVTEMVRITPPTASAWSSSRPCHCQ